MTSPNTPQPTITVNYWAITFMAAAVLMITMGARQSLGLFVSPLNTATGLGLTAISFAMAVGQFTWGAVQPIAGAVADKYGPGAGDCYRIGDALDRVSDHADAEQ